VLERIHFAVEHGAALLHPPIVTATENAAAMNENGADRDAAFGESTLGLLDCRAKKLVVHAFTAPHP